MPARGSARDVTAAVLAAVADSDLAEASAINDAASRLGGLLVIAVVSALIGAGGGRAVGAALSHGYQPAMIALGGLCAAAALVTGLLVSGDRSDAARIGPPVPARLRPGGRRRSGCRIGRSARRVDRRRRAASIGQMSSLWESRHIAITAAGVPLAALGIAACGGGSDTPRPPKTLSGRPATVGLESAGSLGKLLVDSCGRTLCLFRKDAGRRQKVRRSSTTGTRSTAIRATRSSVRATGSV
jgi:hypothetical protein